ncbi:MAG: N-acetyltransferase [Salinisphaera sp.]|nr:N-acetyltransferase [Salinisphaera sp.]
MSSAAADNISIHPIHGKADLRRFVHVPWDIYRDDPAWVAPLKIERRMQLSEKQNPLFEHLDWQGWLALKGDQPIGRITAQIDRLRADYHEDKAGYFGMLEACDDPAVFAALLATAEDWLRARGMTHVHGPFNLNINEECGLLIDGLETPPVVMMGHAREYAQRHVEALGYTKAVDTLAYWIELDFGHPQAMQRLLQRYASRVTVRPIDGKRFTEELEVLRSIFNDAWSNNWGFVPFTEAEFRELGKALRMMLPDELVQIAEVDGEPAAFIVGLPNLNEAIRDLNGRLLPLGIFKLLWRLKVRFPKTARVPLMGVRKSHQQGLIGAALAYRVIGTLQGELYSRGARHCELSWILENNRGMRDIIESIGGRVYKTYRLYSKAL